MSDELQTLLGDLARYLEQQQRAGSLFFFAEPAASEAETAATATAPPLAAPPPAAEPAPVSTGPAPVDSRQEREQQFQRECAAFVRDTLAQIARTRAAASAPREPLQADIFGAATAPALEPEPPVLAPAAKAAALAALAAEVHACQRCPLHAGRANAVPGTGNPDAGLVLIGEAPGQEEDRQGLPFVGRSGQLLTDILRSIGFARDDVFICNILKCRPPGNRDPERAEAAACEPYLRRQLAVIQPRVILCLGRIAAQTLLGTTASLGALRQAVHFYAGVPVLATYHPASLLRNPHQKRDTWNDVRKLRALYDILCAPGA